MYYVTFLKPQDKKLESLEDKFFEKKRGHKTKDIRAFEIRQGFKTEEEIAEEDEQWLIGFGTETVAVDKLPDSFIKAVNLPFITEKLKEFNNRFLDAVEDKSKRKLYKEVIYYEERRAQSKYIPRQRLLFAFDELIKIIKNDICVGNTRLLHDSVVTSDNITRSRPYDYYHHKCVYPIKDFYIHLKSDFIFESLKKVYPFCVIMEDEVAKDELCKALGVAFYYGKMYKNTSVFELIMNAAMIPVDHTLNSLLECYDGQRFAYNRTKEKIEISSKEPFTVFEMRFFIDKVLEELNTPFKVDIMAISISDNGRRNTIESVIGKTPISSLSIDEIKHFHNMLEEYIVDKKSGISWSKEKVVTLEALRNYYDSKGFGSVSKIIKSLNEEFDFDVVKSIIQDLKE